MRKSAHQHGNILLCALCTILIVSAIAGTVLLNCTTRYNVASGQVQSWKAALQAAEAGGDIAYAEIRKTILDPSHAFSGWTTSGAVRTSPQINLGSNNLQTGSTVDLFYTDVSTGSPWYRIRSKGVAPALGLLRTGMDDRMTSGARGDSLLRKVDFYYDHFISAYGPNGDGVGKSLVAVSQPQLARRIELVAAPMTPFEAAIKCTGTFYGLGDAALIDSYSSANGAYYFCANNPADPYFGDSRSGSVEIGTAVATIRGMLYGNLATNGGTIVRSSQITGTIDNNVPITIPPFKMPTNLPVPQPSPASITATTSLTPPAAGTAAAPTYYVLSALTGKLTVNPVGSAETYVVIHVTNDIVAEIDVKPKVHLKVLFDGNMNVKARDINNETGLAANLQYYAISPANPATIQTIAIAPPGNFAATIYAPSADFTLNGNPDIIGAIVCKSFYGNGNTSWHYDRQLDNEGDVVDYRIASYVEDIR